MANRLKSVAIAVCGVAWFALTSAKATTVIPATFEEPSDRADFVFVGKLASSPGELRSVGTNCVFFTMVDFETNEVLKWNADRDMLGITKIL